ncbi:MAG: hypothetical protein RLZZ09_3294 [Pseudomonadota bacterium]|jgi:hypothetical protein
MKPAARILALIIAAGLLLFTSIMVKWTLAARYSELANDWMVAWALDGKRNPTYPQIIEVEQLLRRAITLDPNNPEHHDRLSQLHLWSMATSAGKGEAAIDDIVAKGISEARLSIAGQPGNPIAWARLLVWKAGADQLDREFETALERTTTLGRWHVAIHGTVLNALLPRWARLSAHDRDILLNTGVRGLRQAPSRALKLLQRYGRLEEVCLRLVNEPRQWEKYCRKPAGRR